MPSRVKAPAPVTGLVSVKVDPPAMSKRPPPARNSVARFELKLAAARSVPPSSVRPVPAAPRLLSWLTCSTPPLMAVPPV